jgi:hypothetical protein
MDWLTRRHPFGAVLVVAVLAGWAFALVAAVLGPVLAVWAALVQRNREAAVLYLVMAAAGLLTYGVSRTLAL